MKRLGAVTAGYNVVGGAVGGSRRADKGWEGDAPFPLFQCISAPSPRFKVRGLWAKNSMSPRPYGRAVLLFRY